LSNLLPLPLGYWGQTTYRKSADTIRNIIRNEIPSNALIQSGDNTHSQDQLITFVNFNTINTIVRRPVNPIPPPVDVVVSAIVLPFVKCP
jgi:hypothetical protein